MRVVIDTNIIVSALIHARLLQPACRSFDPSPIKGVRLTAKHLNWFTGAKPKGRMPFGRQITRHSTS